jgi:2,3-bisphosphoglycerate-dependent phosphoglycerate mutase
VWNLENKFTGWVDVDLTEKGEQEAERAGSLLKGMKIDLLFTSILKRAMRTADIALKVAGINDIPTERSEKLNERHYGDLQGLNKAETAAKHGEEQVKIWRRSYDIAPPNGESLKLTQERVMPYYLSEIESHLRAGKNILIAAHGNSLRALIMHLENLSPEEILQTEVPTGTPRLYELDENLNVLDKRFLQ